jgi:hypothetical protein
MAVGGEAVESGDFTGNREEFAEPMLVNSAASHARSRWRLPPFVNGDGAAALRFHAVPVGFEAVLVVGFVTEKMTFTLTTPAISVAVTTTFSMLYWKYFVCSQAGGRVVCPLTAVAATASAPNKIKLHSLLIALIVFMSLSPR